MKKFQASSLFETVAYIHIKNKKILLSKSKKHTAFIMPGGKREQGENDVQALTRELQEELNINLIPKSIKLYGIFEAQAYDKPEGTTVRIICYLGTHTGQLTPNAEIEFIQFFTHSGYLSMQDTAPGVRLILNDLKEKNLIN